MDWTRIERAVRAVSIPVAGNGSAWTYEDGERMRRETGCEFVMVGRGAIADPWVFSGREVSRHEAAGFLVEYADVLTSLGAKPKGAAGRVKQLLNYWTAGGLVADDQDRLRWLRRTDVDGLLDELRHYASEATTVG